MRALTDYDDVLRVAEGEVVTHELNWLDWLGNDSIDTATIEGQGITVTALGADAITQRFRIEDVVDGGRYELIATVVTANGDTLKASLLVIGERP